MNDVIRLFLDVLGRCAYSLILVGTLALGAEGDKLKACDLALNACNEYASALFESNTKLKAQVSTCMDRLADAQSGPILPTWLIISSSIVAGVAIGYTLGHR